jgi:hypothetical protein
MHRRRDFGIISRLFTRDPVWRFNEACCKRFGHFGLYSQQYSLTSESVEGYHELLNTSIADLKEHLRSLGKKLDLIHGQNATDSEQGASEVRRI